MGLVVAVLSGEAAWAVDDQVARRMAATADMQELAGSGGASGGTAEPEADLSVPDMLVGWIGTGAISLAVVGARADRTVQLSWARECHSPEFQINLP